MKYRKKPIVVEAMQFTDKKSSDEIIQWANGNADYLYNINKNSAFADTNKIVCGTLEGVMYASKGDWIIKGVNGEFYPCKDDIFQKTYEEVEA